MNSAKKTMLLILIVSATIFPLKGNGQSLKYENLSFSDALAKGKSTDQILFIQMDSECEQCNSVADQGLSGNEITALFEKFICIKINYNTEDYKKITSRYHIYPHFPSSLFIDKEGNYLASIRNKSTSNRNEYIKLAATALSEMKNPPLKRFEKGLAEERTDKELLKQYIIRLNRENFDIEDLTEKYANALTLKELQDTTELKFLMSTAPPLNSFLFNLLYQNAEQHKRIFESLPLQERIKINIVTVRKSKEKAIRDKDRGYMMRISSFLRSTYSTDYKMGEQAAMNLQMDFYQAIKDSNAYYFSAQQYYNLRYNRVNLDSICKTEVNHTFQRADGSIVRGGIFYQTGNQLNKMAFTISELSRDKERLGFALKLSEHTLVYNYPAFIDTYAQILYKLGAKMDALYWQEKAVKLCDSLHQPNMRIKEVLEKMKSRNL